MFGLGNEIFGFPVFLICSFWILGGWCPSVGRMVGSQGMVVRKLVGWSGRSVVFDMYGISGFYWHLNGIRIDLQGLAKCWRDQKFVGIFPPLFCVFECLVIGLLIQGCRMPWDFGMSRLGFGKLNGGC